MTIKKWMALACLGLVSMALAGEGEEYEVHPGFTLSSLRPQGFEPRVTGMDFLSGGRLAVSTWRPNEVYILSGWDGPPARMTARKAVTGFKEVMGLCVVKDTIFVADQDAVYALSDKNGDGLPETRTLVGSIPFSGSFHEWSFGLVCREGKFLTALSLAATPTGKTAIPQKAPLRGSVISMTRNGKVETIATGLRAPDGIGQGPDGEIFATDNQGSWLPASKFIHVVQGRNYGHRATPPVASDSAFPSLPAVWLPYGTVTRSPTQPVYIQAGQYAGQFFYGDIAFGVVRRINLEKVAGEYQGCVLRFSGGFEAGIHRLLASPDGSLLLGGLGNGDAQNWGWREKTFGLQRLKPNGKTVFEILTVHARRGGFEVEFSTAPGPEGSSSGHYAGKQWWYEPTSAYGGPAKDITEASIRSAHVSLDGRRIFLEMPDLRPQQVVQVHLEGIHSSSGQELWTKDFWYTLNAFSNQEFQP